MPGCESWLYPLLAVRPKVIILINFSISINSSENSIDNSTSIISHRVGVRIKYINICQALRTVHTPLYHIRVSYYIYVKYTLSRQSY